MNCPCCHRSFSIIYVGRVRSISEMSLSAVHETQRHETRRGHVLLRMPCGYQGAHVWTRQIALKYKRSRCSQESQHYTAWLLPMFLCVLKPCATGQRAPTSRSITRHKKRQRTCFGVWTLALIYFRATKAALPAGLGKH